MKRSSTAIAGCAGAGTGEAFGLALGGIDAWEPSSEFFLQTLVCSSGSLFFYYYAKAEPAKCAEVCLAFQFGCQRYFTSSEGPRLQRASPIQAHNRFFLFNMSYYNYIKYFISHVINTKNISILSPKVEQSSK